MIQVDSCIIFERMWQVGSFTIQEVPTPKKWGESKKQVDMLLGWFWVIGPDSGTN